MELGIPPEAVLLTLGAVASALFMSGYLLLSIMITGLGFATFLFFRRKEKRFQDLLRS
jgi:hypothetical protein